MCLWSKCFALEIWILLALSSNNKGTYRFKLIYWGRRIAAPYIYVYSINNSFLIVVVSLYTSMIK